MRSVKWFSLLAVILMLTAVSSTTLAQGKPGPDRGGPMPGRGGMPHPEMHHRGPDQGARHPGPHGQAPMVPPMDLLAELGATDKQIDALKELDFTHREKVIDLRSRVEKAELGLERLVQDTGSSKKDLLVAADAVSSTRAEIFRDEIATRFDVRQILGEELFQKLKEQPGPRHGKPGCRKPAGPGEQSGRGNIE